MVILFPFCALKCLNIIAISDFEAWWSFNSNKTVISFDFSFHWERVQREDSLQQILSWNLVPDLSFVSWVLTPPVPGIQVPLPDSPSVQLQSPLNTSGNALITRQLPFLHFYAPSKTRSQNRCNELNTVRKHSVCRMDVRVHHSAKSLNFEMSVPISKHEKNPTL